MKAKTARKSRVITDEVAPEYAFKDMVRGKYAARYWESVALARRERAAARRVRKKR